MQRDENRKFGTVWKNVFIAVQSPLHSAASMLLTNRSSQFGTNPKLFTPLPRKPERDANFALATL